MTKPEEEGQGAIKPTHTACRGCVFSVAEGRTQTGCKLGRTDVYRGRGQLLEAYDDSCEFYIVDGVKCQAYRDEKWGEKHRGDDARSEAVRREAGARCAFIVLADEGFGLTLLSSEEADVRPSEIVLVTKGDGADIRRKIEDCPMPCVLVRCLEPDASAARMVDMAVARIQRSNWYTVWRGGRPVPPDFITRLDAWADLGLAEAVCLAGCPSSHHGDTIRVGTHRHHFFCGNAPCDVGEWLSDKVRDYANNSGEHHLLGLVQDVVPEMAASEDDE